MNAIRKFGYASAAAIALATSSGASAADYLFNFQFDALGNFAAANIVYVADTLDPDSLTYVNGDVNGGTSPTLFRTFIGASGQRGYQFGTSDLFAPAGTVVDVFFRALSPFAAGQTYETDTAGRGVGTGSGAFYQYTTGRLTITERMTAVPEPATWAMLILGFGAVGGALRRRSALQSVRVAYS